MNSFLRTSLKLAACSMLFYAVPVFAAPVISSVTPGTAAVGSTVTLQATVTDSYAIASCHLYVESEDVGIMNQNGTVASLDYVFHAGGVHTVFVFCRDEHGGMASGANSSIFVTGPTVESAPLGGNESEHNLPPAYVPPATVENNQVPTSTTPSTLVATTTDELVKLHCDDGALPDDPCTAVYYISSDDKRHAFPNHFIYSTWYADFSGVQEVTTDQMSQYPLGANVAYRPGVRMVKFTTDPKVYAVGHNGELRWVSSEAVAVDLYGADWNTMIDDIPDTFYINYHFGTDISGSTDFNATTEREDTPSIEANQ